MSLFAGILAAILIPLVLTVGCGIVWLVYRFGGGLKCAGITAGALVVLGLIAAVTMMSGGARIDASVVSKTENVTHSRNAVVPALIYQFVVQAQPGEGATEGSGDLVTLDLNAHDFDRLHVGDTIVLRVKGSGPFRVAHLDGAGLNLPWQRMSGLFGFVAGVGTIAAAGALAALVFVRGQWWWVAGGLVVLAAGLDIAAMHDAWAPRPVSGQGRTVSVTRVSQVLIYERYHRRPREVTLSPAYDEIELSLVPAPGFDPVRVIDRVDAMATPPLPGQAVNVVFDPKTPRAARLVGAHRSFALRAELGEFIWAIAKFVLPTLAFAGLCLWLARSRRKTAGAKAAGT